VTFLLNEKKNVSIFFIKSIFKASVISMREFPEKSLESRSRNKSKEAKGGIFDFIDHPK